MQKHEYFSRSHTAPCVQQYPDHFCNFTACGHFSSGMILANKSGERGSSKKKREKERNNTVFSPSPHWLLCEVPSFDINWVKHKGGREGGQQLDPTVNVTLVSPLHRCHRHFGGELLFLLLYLCAPLAKRIRGFHC